MLAAPLEPAVYSTLQDLSYVLGLAPRSQLPTVIKSTVYLATISRTPDYEPPHECIPVQHRGEVPPAVSARYRRSSASLQRSQPECGVTAFEARSSHRLGGEPETGRVAPRLEWVGGEAVLGRSGMSEGARCWIWELARRRLYGTQKLRQVDSTDIE